MATSRVLSDRELNRALLARQLLLKRAAVTPAAAIERLAGLQAQFSPAPYIGLWSRLARFAIPDLEQALEARTVVKATLMLWWLIATQGWLVHVPPSGTWGHHRAGDLIAADSWIRALRVPELSSAVRLTVERHLAAFGPATVDDISSWSSIRTPAVRSALRELGSKIRTFTDPRGRALYDLKGAPLPDADTPAPVRYLPKWDSTLLAYAAPERVRILSEAHRKTVIGKNGDVTQTILVDGAVAGTWAVTVKTGEATIAVTAFTKLAKADAAALTEEGERLARLIAPDAKAHRVAFA